MTTAELLAVVAERGLTIVRQGSVLALRGPAEEKTPALLAVLKIHRQDLLEQVPEEAVCASEAQTEPEDPVQSHVPDWDEAEEVEIKVPFYVKYLWGTGHTRVRRLGDPVPGAAWWWQMCGPGWHAQEWEPLPDCPAGQKVPKEIDG